MTRKRNIAALLRRSASEEALQQISEDLSAHGDLGRALPAPVRGETRQTESPSRTEIYTYFTRPNNKNNLFYNAEKAIRVRLLLETAGPVSVSTRQNILPVLSGNGILLQTGEYVEFTLNRGDRLYVASTSINRMQVFIVPVPWFESIILTLKAILGKGA